MSSFDDERRRREMDRARQIITGDNPRASTSEDAKQAQRRNVAEMVRRFYDAGYDPMVLVEMLLAGAAFIGDNHGVGRGQMAKVLHELNLSPDRELIYTPR